MNTTQRHTDNTLPGAQPCRSCRTPIVWAETTAHSKPIPVEPDPADSGTLAIYRLDGGGLRAVVVTGPRRDAFRAAGQPLYHSHFVNCPHADNWRSK